MSVTATLMGGCANQMFIYATALALSRRLGTDLRLDVSRYDNPGEHRMYSLGLFAGVTEPIVRGGSGKLIREQGMPYNPAIFDNAPRECSLYGYWQTEKYFSELKSELRTRFMPKADAPAFHRAMSSKIQAAAERSCFLTVRRTDYVGNNFHGLLPMEYYLRATETIAAMVPDPIFFVFSDDPEWCEQNFKLPYRTIIAGNYHRTVKPNLGREDEELWLMRLCQHAILANSSYSWFGAWLGRADDGGIVIAPKNWFGPASKEDARDICPERWLRL